jgi:hypothetical protein
MIDASVAGTPEEWRERIQMGYEMGIRRVERFIGSTRCFPTTSLPRSCL